MWGVVACFQLETAEKELLRHDSMAASPPAQMLTGHSPNRHCCLKQGIAPPTAQGGFSPLHPHAASLHVDASPPFPWSAQPAASWPSLYTRQRSGAAVQVGLPLKAIHPSGKGLTACVLTGITGKGSAKTDRKC